MNAQETYIAAQETILRLRAQGAATREDEDTAADALEPLWWAMSPEERRSVEEYFAPPEAIDATAVHKLPDVDDYEHHFPRTKAPA